jgi:hypothetical protein
MPDQIYTVEKNMFTAFIGVVFVMNIILMIMNLLLVTYLEWNPLANYV